MTWTALLAGSAASFWFQPARAADDVVEGAAADAPSVDAPSVETQAAAIPAAEPQALAAHSVEAQAAESPVESQVVDAPPTRSAAGPFDQHRVRITGLIGTGWAANDNYLIAGIGVGYYLLKGLDVGVDYEIWLFGDPTFQRLSPGIRYVLDSKTIKPYVGVFYRHTFISDLEDYDQVGARAGVYIVPKGNVFFGAGAVYERLLDCDDGSLIDCDEVYPEVTFGVTL